MIVCQGLKDTRPCASLTGDYDINKMEMNKMNMDTNQVYINGKLRDIREITNPIELEKANKIMAMRVKLEKSMNFDEDDD